MASHLPRGLAQRDLENVLAPLDLACGLPAKAFIDASVFSFEQAEIFGRSWICVGRIDELELPGQWLRETVAGEPILVVRGADLRLRAFFDVCRHRGASVVARAACGRAMRLECPYHGWTYELDGRLASAPFTATGFARQGHGLHEGRVDVWRGFVFVTLDPAIADLESWLGETPPWLRRDVDALSALRRGRRQEYEVHANWKLLVENFQESHHFTRVHRALEHLTPTGQARSWLTKGPWLGGSMEIEGAETVSLDGRRHGRPLLVPQDGVPTVFDAMLFPCLLTSLQPDYLLTYRLTPLAAGHTRVVADIHFHAAAVVRDFEPLDVFEFWDRVNAEDRAICEDQQANATSRAFEPARYVTVEEGMHAFDAMVARAYLR
jgi:glycine betaine catabolism A